MIPLSLVAMFDQHWMKFWFAPKTHVLNAQLINFLFISIFKSISEEFMMDLFKILIGMACKIFSHNDFSIHVFTPFFSNFLFIVNFQKLEDKFWLKSQSFINSIPNVTKLKRDIAKLIKNFLCNFYWVINHVSFGKRNYSLIHKILLSVL